MILVLLGTQNNSFHRLLEQIEVLIRNGSIKEKVIVQAGRTKYSSDNMEIISLIPQDELKDLVKKANYVITHGGVGSIVMALKMGKKIIAVPRLKKYDEHINDHQIQIIEAFKKQDFLIGISDVKELENAIKKLTKFKPKKFESQTQNMINLIEDFIDNN